MDTSKIIRKLLEISYLTMIGSGMFSVFIIVGEIEQDGDSWLLYYSIPIFFVFLILTIIFLIVEKRIEDGQRT